MCNYPGRSAPILIADDDQEDRWLIREALNRCGIASPLFFVNDGQTALDFLRRTGSFQDSLVPRPGLILLDLNMPRKSGKRVLEEIKTDTELSMIPTVVLTTSDSEDDIVRSYRLGANSFITKPVTFDELVAVMEELKRYWFETVRIPMSVDES